MTYEIESKIQGYLLGLPDYAQDGSILRLSKIGECPRLLDYEMQKGRSPFDFRQVMRMHSGTYLGHMWRDIMSGALGPDFTGAEEELTLLINVDGVIHKILGHPDGNIESLNALWELKSVSDSTFQMVQNQGHALPQHYAQANIYAYLKQRERILFQYFNTDTKESLYLIAPTSEVLAQESINVFRQRIINKSAGVIADRPHTDPTASPCWYCPRKAECYAGYAEEVKSMTLAVLDHDQETYAHEFTKNIWSSRSLRLSSEKTEAEAKKMLADFLLKLGFNSAKVGSFVVNVKLGKNNNPLVDVKEVTNG